MSNTVHSFGSTASIYGPRGTLAAPDQPPADLVGGPVDSTGLSAEARLAGFPSGSYEDVQSAPIITRPSIFGPRVSAGDTIESGRVFVIQEGNWYGLNATLNDAQGNSFGVDFSAQVGAARPEGGHEANIRVGGQSYPGTMDISDHNKTKFTYKENGRVQMVTLLRDQKSGFTHVKFVPPYQAVASQNGDVTARIPGVNYR
jgi:hypothetical protein